MGDRIVRIVKSSSGHEVGLWIENSKSWKTRSIEYLCIEKSRSDDISQVNLIVGANELAKMETSSICKAS